MLKEQLSGLSPVSFGGNSIRMIIKVINKSEQMFASALCHGVQRS